MPEKYTDSDLNHYLSRLEEQLTRIEQQVTETNGRLKKLEIWKAWMTGGMAVLSLLVIPIAITLATELIQATL